MTFSLRAFSHFGKKRQSKWSFILVVLWDQEDNTSNTGSPWVESPTDILSFWMPMLSGETWTGNKLPLMWTCSQNTHSLHELGNVLRLVRSPRQVIEGNSSNLLSKNRALWEASNYSSSRIIFQSLCKANNSKKKKLKKHTKAAEKKRSRLESVDKY